MLGSGAPHLHPQVQNRVFQELEPQHHVTLVLHVPLPLLPCLRNSVLAVQAPEPTDSTVCCGPWVPVFSSSALSLPHHVEDVLLHRSLPFGDSPLITPVQGHPRCQQRRLRACGSHLLRQLTRVWVCWELIRQCLCHCVTAPYVLGIHTVSSSAEPFWPQGHLRGQGQVLSFCQGPGTGQELVGEWWVVQEFTL